MPSCFQLLDKKTNQPAILQRIDELMCAHFQEPCHPKHWFHGWYNYIGLSLATGKSFEDITAKCLDYIEEQGVDLEGIKYWLQMLKINLWLAKNYNSNAFYESKS